MRCEFIIIKICEYVALELEYGNENDATYAQTENQNIWKICPYWIGMSLRKLFLNNVLIMFLAASALSRSYLRSASWNYDSKWHDYDFDDVVVDGVKCHQFSSKFEK